MSSASRAVTEGSAPDTRTRILESALTLFTEQGFTSTSLQQIADRLSVTKAALYYHFRSKDGLLEALVTPAVSDIESLLDKYADSARTPADRRHFMEDYLDYLIAHRRLLAFVVRDLASLAHPALSAGSQRRQARVNAMLAGEHLGFNEQIRVALAFHGIGAVIAQNPDADPERLREALLEAANSLLRRRRSRKRA
jgi:AcrR family transcriptional regulator